MGKAEAGRADLGADRERALKLTPVSRETLARLDRFAALLLDWQKRINLVAPSTLPQLWTRHIADSLQLLDLAPDARIWVDLGSGAGFPGLVIACALADRGDESVVHLVESNAKKAAFLREAARITGAPVVVHHIRIEKFVESFAGRVDVVAARALAPLEDLLRLSYPLLQGARALYMKGRDVEAELTDAAKSWKVNAQLVPSRTDPQGMILVIDGAQPLSKSNPASPTPISQ